jgi:hypothetical protein
VTHATRHRVELARAEFDVGGALELDDQVPRDDQEQLVLVFPATTATVIIILLKVRYFVENRRAEKIHKRMKEARLRSILRSLYCTTAC